MAVKYCWVITQAAGPSCCDVSSYSVLEFGFKLDSLLYTWCVQSVRLAQNSTFDRSFFKRECQVSLGLFVLDSCFEELL